MDNAPTNPYAREAYLFDFTLNAIKFVAESSRQLHKLKVIHGDIKPLNFLVKFGPDGKPSYRMCDLGIANTIYPVGETKITGFKGTYRR